MGATKNLGLTQFEPDTVTNWLDQYNKDMLKIDNYVGDENVAGAALEERLTTDETNITNNRNQINENTQDIANILNDISEIEGGESGASLKSLNERTTTLETGLQTATNDITNVTNKANATATEVETIDSRLGTVENDVSELSVVVGNSALQSGKTITGVIGNKELPVNQSITSLLGNTTIDGTITKNIYDLQHCGSILRLSNMHIVFKPSELAYDVTSNSYFNGKRFKEFATLITNSANTVTSIDIFIDENFNNYNNITTYQNKSKICAIPLSGERTISWNITDTMYSFIEENGMKKIKLTIPYAGNIPLSLFSITLILDIT